MRIIPQPSSQQVLTAFYNYTSRNQNYWEDICAKDVKYLEFPLKNRNGEDGIAYQVYIEKHMSKKELYKLYVKLIS